MQSYKKKEIVSGLKAKFKEMNLVVVINYKGLTVEAITGLRREMYNQGAELKVVKNTLARIACKDTPYEALDNLFLGSTALAFSKDSIAAAKSIFEFSENSPNIEIVGGALGNKELSVSDIEALAKLPSLDEIRSKIILTINSPASKLARTIKEPCGKLVRILSAYSKK